MVKGKTLFSFVLATNRIYASIVFQYRVSKSPNADSGVGVFIVAEISLNCRQTTSPNPENRSQRASPTGCS